MSNLRLSYLQKVGGGGGGEDICTGHPPTQKVGGYIPLPFPRDLRQWLPGDWTVYHPVLYQNA